MLDLLQDKATVVDAIAIGRVVIEFSPEQAVIEVTQSFPKVKVRTVAEPATSTALANGA